MTQAPTITRPAHAKLNLALWVGPPEPPKGYHPIESWFVPIDLHDTVRVTRLPEGEPSRYVVAWADDAPRPSPIDWPIDKDLATRAHRLLEERAGRPLPVEIVVHKRIPVGGGLGGGSADAAAVLIAVNDLFALGQSVDDLRQASTALGSDIAYFITPPRQSHPSGAIVSGFGDRFEPSAAIGGDALLVLPPFGCPTGPVYQAFDRLPETTGRLGEARQVAVDSLAAGRILSERLFNGLLPAACKVEPRLADLMDRLAPALHAAGADLHMTGSGSTLFILPRPAGDLLRAKAAVRQTAPEVACLPTRILP